MSSLTVFKPVLTATDASRTWAASTLADLPVIVKFCEVTCSHDEAAQTTTDSEGRHFRHAFHIGVRYGSHFAIHLYRGATKSDLSRARGMITRLKDGIVCDRLWEEFKSGAGRHMDSWLPFDPEKWSPELRPCLDANCRHEWHEWETRGDTYPNDPCDNQTIRNDFYTIVLQRHQGDPWTVESWQACDQLEGAEGLNALRNWQNDFADLQAECDKLNALSPALEAAA